jgi:molybdenum cofactor guanylyltransferase
MGTDKATLKVGGKALIELVYDRAREVFQNIIVLSNHLTTLDGVNAPIVKDVLPIQGSMVGIVSALLASADPYVFVLACDLPFISVGAINYMLGQVHGEDLVIPKTPKGYEPLHAIYNRSCISHMLGRIGRGRLKITDLLPYLSVRALTDQAHFVYNGTSVFMNINTQEELSLAEHLVGR